jgi:hypothetical protein
MMRYLSMNQREMEEVKVPHEMKAQCMNCLENYVTAVEPWRRNWYVCVDTRQRWSKSAFPKLVYELEGGAASCLALFA